MPGDLRVAFWNVQNLFPPGVVDRGPQSTTELEEKLDVLAEVIGGFFDGGGPDLMGFAEVGTLSILNSLISRFSSSYVCVWEDSPSVEQAGLGLIAREDLFSDVSVLSVYRPTVAARPRSMIVRCELKSDTEPFLVVVNHWKSRLGIPELHQRDRLETADWLGDYLANSAEVECVVVIGDFNAEPFEPPFGELRLRAKRTFSNALWSSATPAYLYNAAWRLLTEPDMWETAGTDGYEEPRPKTTHGDSGVNVLDHMIVSGKALRNGPLTFREATMSLHCNHRTSKRNSTGVLRPRPWKFVSTGEHDGSSDHFPLVATFATR